MSQQAGSSSGHLAVIVTATTGPETLRGALDTCTVLAIAPVSDMVLSSHYSRLYACMYGVACTHRKSYVHISSMPQALLEKTPLVGIGSSIPIRI